MKLSLHIILYLAAAFSLQALTFSVSDETPGEFVRDASIICIGEVLQDGESQYRFRVAQSLKGDAVVGKTYAVGGDHAHLAIGDFEKNFRSKQTIFLGALTTEGVMTTSYIYWSFWPQGFEQVPGNIGRTFAESLKFIKDTQAKQGKTQ
ncbi:hypothetical protein DB345_02645 [Spartobacteria bacterium LR76]|nr:hypothetical protein DB345_02645 [Spartobacteria bacterium LR76]